MDSSKLWGFLRVLGIFDCFWVDRGLVPERPIFFGRQQLLNASCATEQMIILLTSHERNDWEAVGKFVGRIRQKGAAVSLEPTPPCKRAAATAAAAAAVQ